MAKHLTDRQGATELVVRAAETHADRVGKVFEAEFSRYVLGKERMPDIGLALKLVARAMRDRRKTLADAHDRDVESSRGAEDDPAARLSAEVAFIRATVEGVYGAAGLKALGLDQKPEIEPMALLSQARALSERLGSPDVELPAPLRRGFRVDTVELKDDLEELIDALDLPLQRGASGVPSVPGAPSAQATREAKARALAANDDLFGRGAEFISAAFRLVGDEALAGKVRPSAHRPGRTAEDRAPSPSDSGSGSGGAAGSGSFSE
jgi:hypothetical protein